MRIWRFLAGLFVALLITARWTVEGTTQSAHDQVDVTVPPTNTHVPTMTDFPTIPPTNTHVPTTTPVPTNGPTLTPSHTPNPTHTLTPSRTPSATFTATAIPDAVTTAGFRLLTGPGFYFLDAGLVGNGTKATVLLRTQDSLWVKISYLPAPNLPAKEGWIEAKMLKFNIDLSTVSVISASDILAIPTTNPCTSVVGDSVAAGGAVFEIPDTGYARAPLAPIATFITLRFRAAGVKDKEMKVYDRSVGATGISSANHPSYFNTPQFAQLQHDHCKFTVILPWINDLSPADPNPAAAAPAHVNALGGLVRQIASFTPYSRIIVFNYYKGNPTKFALTSFATGFLPAVIDAFNQQIAAACGGGSLSGPMVMCMDINNAFVGMGTNYVVGPMTRDEINKELVSGINPDELKLYNYWADGHPGGQLLGDGVHLSYAGKVALANYLVPILQTLPDLKPYIPPTFTPTAAPSSTVITQPATQTVIPGDPTVTTTPSTATPSVPITQTVIPSDPTVIGTPSTAIPTESATDTATPAG